MNVIRFNDVIINLDQVAYIESGSHEKKPSINFVFPASTRDNTKHQLELDTMPVWFECVESRDDAFNAVCDRIGVVSLPITAFDRYRSREEDEGVESEAA